VACRCGQVTAQPRFVIYDMVWGRFGRVHRRSLFGHLLPALRGPHGAACIFRELARRLVVVAHGPRETVRALINNIRGGRKPADRNARLLIRQARAFQKRGDTELARNAANRHGTSHAIRPCSRRSPASCTHSALGPAGC